MTHLPAGEHPHAPKIPPTRVLVVDDEPLVLWSVTETLRDHGCAVEEAADAKSALRALCEDAVSPDAVVLDLNLPDSHDLRLLAAVRRIAPSARIILMTAFGSSEVREAARHLGVFSVLDKPFDLDDLEALVDRAAEMGRA